MIWPWIQILSHFCYKVATIASALPVKFSFSEKDTKIGTIWTIGFWCFLSKCQHHEEDFFRLCVLLRKSESYLPGVKKHAQTIQIYIFFCFLIIFPWSINSNTNYLATILKVLNFFNYRMLWFESILTLWLVLELESALKPLTVPIRADNLRTAPSARISR